MSKSRFKFKEGVGNRQMEFGSGEFINNETMTDEKAIKFLKKNPNKHILFDTLPKNWKELVEGKKNPPANKSKNKSKGLKKDKDLKLSELREKYPDIKATSIKAFLEKVAALPKQSQPPAPPAPDANGDNNAGAEGANSNANTEKTE